MKSNAEYRARYYEKNKQKHIDAVQALKRQKREYVQNIKATTPCTDCGQSFPYYVMDFDHCTGEKFSSLAHIHRYGWQVIYDEIAKCDVVCKNCHAKRTHQRGYIYE